MENFTFYLNFKNDDTGLVQISEPVKWDGANFVIEQDKKRYGRDVIYGNEEVSLEFYEGVYENGLTHEFEKLLQYYNDYGFESEIEFILQRGNVDFVVGNLDFELAETDGLTYLKCKVIQATKQALVKRREDVPVDVFANKDLDDNDITPVTTERIFLKAKPIFQASKWKSISDEKIAVAQYTANQIPSLPIPTIGDLEQGINTALVVENFGIENTLSNLSAVNPLNVASGFPLDGIGFEYINAKNDLSNLKIEIRDLVAKARSEITDTSNRINSATGYAKLVVKYGYDYLNGTDMTEIILQQINFDDNDSAFVNFNTSYDVTIPLLRSGQRLFIYIQLNKEVTYTPDPFGLFNFSYIIYCNMSNINISATATSTAVSSVIDGVRHIDYIKQCYKSATGMNVIAPKYDVGGEHYDNFVFNGKLIRQFKDKPFYGTIKENNEQLIEINSDYQVNQENVFIGQYSDFYPNNEIGSFLTAPDDTFKSNFNDRYAVQTIEYKYKSFEQDRDEENTIDAVHTSSKWLTSNKNVEANLVIDVPFVRDAFEIESTRRQNIIAKDTTSLSNDDKVYIIDVVPLAPNTFEQFTKLLNFRESATDLKFLSDGTFTWDVLGFSVGNTIFYNNTPRTVLAIEPNILTITGTGFVESGQVVATFRYPLTNVAYINRTTQGFSVIENIFSGDNYSNLRYTIKRNMQYFYNYFKTCLKYKPDGKIKNTYFKSNGLATTKYLTNPTLTENADILVSELGSPILTPNLYDGVLVADFDEVKDLLDKMQTINPDNTIGGYFRVMDNEFRVLKVYPTKFDYTWATAEMKFTAEAMQESEYLEVNKIGDLIYINEMGYPQDIIYPIDVRTDGDYIQLLDSRGVGLHNKINFNKVRVNSNIFSNIVELTEALLML